MNVSKERLVISCPRCDYSPAHVERWVCEPGCGTHWNTFWTRGLCPGCGKLWNVTQCPECGHISPHNQWYRNPVPRKVQVQEALKSS